MTLSSRFVYKRITFDDTAWGRKKQGVAPKAEARKAPSAQQLLFQKVAQTATAIDDCVGNAPWPMISQRMRSRQWGQAWS